MEEPYRTIFGVMLVVTAILLSGLWDHVVKPRIARRTGRDKERAIISRAIATESFADTNRLFGAVDENTIASAEQRLGVRFPEDYRWILAQCGGGWFRGLTIRGIGLTGDIARFDLESGADNADIPAEYLLIGSCRGNNESSWHRRYLAIDRATSKIVYLFRAEDDGEFIAKPAAPNVLHDELLKNVELNEQYPAMPWDDANVRGWDRYWERVVVDKMMVGWKSFRSGAAVINFASSFIAERNYQTIFVPANGISLLPLALAHQGYTVTAQDISPFACNFVESKAGKASLLALLFPTYDYAPDPGFGGKLVGTPNAEKSQLRVQEEYRPGGTLNFTPGDVFDYEPDAKFDVIIDALFAQTLPGARRAELAARYFKWLRPGGVVVISAMNVGHNPGEREQFEEAFTEAGFVMDSQTGDAFVSRLRSGDKGVFSIHSSG